MKIDTHQHYWHYRAEDFPWISDAMPDLQQDWLPRQSLPAMKNCGVDAVVAVQARCGVQETDFLLALALQNPHMVGVVGWADLTAPALAEHLEAWSVQPAFCGLRHPLQDESDLARLVRDPAFNAGVHLLQRHRLTYDVLVFDHQLPTVAQFCARHEGHWLVLDHLGKPALHDWRRETAARWTEGLRALAAMPHVVCKLSGLVTETRWQAGAGVHAVDRQLIRDRFDQALEAFGPQRLMYGSDWPVCQLAAPYETVYQLAQDWAASRLSAPEQQAFWGGNAVRVYGLSGCGPDQPTEDKGWN